jgi:isopentenyl phosphate kinase
MDLVKFGGSVITNKAKPKTLRPRVLRRLASELAAAPGQLILVHGGGSFGHPGAREGRLHLGLKGKDQLPSVAAVQREMRVLNLRVLEALQAAGLTAVSVPGALVAENKGGRISTLNPGPFMDYLELGLLPVTFGDVVVDKSQGVSICSGDDLMLLLAKGLRAARAIFVADVEGLLDPQGKSMAVVRASELPAQAPLSPQGADVTGGMGRKVEVMAAMARFGVAVRLINGLRPGRLAAALRGEEVPGTRFEG